MPDRNRNNVKTWLAVLAAVVLLGGGWLWLSGAFAPWSFTESVSVEPQGYFFRVKASYTHGDEPIEFDYVAVCGYRTTRYKDGSKSNDGTYDPKVMIKATSDGGALMIRTPRACKGQTTANRKAPADLLPFIIWFDDVEDLTFGWGYASPDAYDSPHAQVRFHGATIEAATAEDWKAWRAKAKDEYEPKGMLPGPWGWSYPARKAGEPERLLESRIAAKCNGYIRLKLPDEARSIAREYWPADRPQFWLSPPGGAGWLPHALIDTDGRKHNLLYEGGHEYRHFTRAQGLAEVGVPTRRGGGTLLYKFEYYAADTFPLLPRSRSMDPVPSAPVDSYPRRLLVHDDWRGFVACGGYKPIDLIDRFDPAFRSKKHPIYVNDESAFDDYNPLVEPTIFYERDEYVFDNRAWPNAM